MSTREQDVPGQEQRRRPPRDPFQRIQLGPAADPNTGVVADTSRHLPFRRYLDEPFISDTLSKIFGYPTSGVQSARAPIGYQAGPYSAFYDPGLDLISVRVGDISRDPLDHLMTHEFTHKGQYTGVGEGAVGEAFRRTAQRRPGDSVGPPIARGTAESQPSAIAGALNTIRDAQRFDEEGIGQYTLARFFEGSPEQIMEQAGLYPEYIPDTSQVINALDFIFKTDLYKDSPVRAAFERLMIERPDLAEFRKPIE